MTSIAMSLTTTRPLHQRLASVLALLGRFPRSLQQLLKHLSSDDLVGWAWDPGPGRTLPPLSRLDTAMQTKIWIEGGAACPQ